MAGQSRSCPNQGGQHVPLGHGEMGGCIPRLPGTLRDAPARRLAHHQPGIEFCAFGILCLLIPYPYGAWLWREGVRPGPLHVGGCELCPTSLSKGAQLSEILFQH